MNDIDRPDLIRVPVETHCMRLLKFDDYDYCQAVRGCNGDAFNASLPDASARMPFAHTHYALNNFCK